MIWEFDFTNNVLDLNRFPIPKTRPPRNVQLL